MEIYLPKLILFVTSIPLSIIIFCYFISEFKLKKSFVKRNELILFCMECKKPFLVNERREIKNCPRCKKNTTSILVS